jgi:hypothetical protein
MLNKSTAVAVLLSKLAPLYPLSQKTGHHEGETGFP